MKSFNAEVATVQKVEDSVGLKWVSWRLERQIGILKDSSFQKLHLVAQ